MRGVRLIWHKNMINLKNGFYPSWWTASDVRDAKNALRYLGLLVDWYEKPDAQPEEEEVA